MLRPVRVDQDDEDVPGLEEARDVGLGAVLHEVLGQQDRHPSGKVLSRVVGAHEHDARLGARRCSVLARVEAQGQDVPAQEALADGKEGGELRCRGSELLEQGFGLGKIMKDRVLFREILGFELLEKGDGGHDLDARGLKVRDGLGERHAHDGAADHLDGEPTSEAACSWPCRGRAVTRAAHRPLPERRGGSIFEPQLKWLAAAVKRAVG